MPQLSPDFLGISTAISDHAISNPHYGILRAITDTLRNVDPRAEYPVSLGQVTFAAYPQLLGESMALFGLACANCPTAPKGVLRAAAALKALPMLGTNDVYVDGVTLSRTIAFMVLSAHLSATDFEKTAVVTAVASIPDFRWNSQGDVVGSAAAFALSHGDEAFALNLADAPSSETGRCVILGSLIRAIDRVTPSSSVRALRSRFTQEIPQDLEDGIPPNLAVVVREMIMADMALGSPSICPEIPGAQHAFYDDPMVIGASHAAIFRTNGAGAWTPDLENEAVLELMETVSGIKSAAERSKRFDLYIAGWLRVDGGTALHLGPLFLAILDEEYQRFNAAFPLGECRALTEARIAVDLVCAIRDASSMSNALQFFDDWVAEGHEFHGTIAILARVSAFVAIAHEKGQSGLLEHSANTLVRHLVNYEKPDDEVVYEFVIRNLLKASRVLARHGHTNMAGRIMDAVEEQACALDPSAWYSAVVVNATVEKNTERAVTAFRLATAHVANFGPPASASTYTAADIEADPILAKLLSTTGRKDPLEASLREMIHLAEFCGYGEAVAHSVRVFDGVAQRTPELSDAGRSGLHAQFLHSGWEIWTREQVNRSPASAAVIRAAA